MSEIKCENVFELGVRLTYQRGSNYRKKCLLFLGGKQSGKTTLINRLLDKKENVEPTFALKYQYIEKQHQDGTREVCDIWELAEGTFFTNLLEFAIDEQNMRSLTAILVVDLTACEELVIATQHFIDSLSCWLSVVFNKLPAHIREEIEAERRARSEKASDINSLDILPVNFIIVGSKFDLIQDLDNEKKQLINKYLRSIAHSHGGSLIYTSIKSEATMSRFKSLLGTKSASTANNSFDLSHPVFIQFGNDSMSKIGDSISSIRSKFEDEWPQIGTKIVVPEDPARDSNFVEREIDLIRMQKDQEIENTRLNLQLIQNNPH